MSDASLPLRVLFFGPIKGRLGTGEIELPCAGALAAEEFWTLLLARHAELEPLRPIIRLARNGEFLAPGARLQPGDEVALIPPVSGG